MTAYGCEGTSGGGIGAVILAGGQGKRMGNCDKSALMLSGKTFLDRLIEEMAGCSELLLAVGKKLRPEILNVRQVTDVEPSLGPLSGIVAALRVCRSSALLVVAVDMPLFTQQLAVLLAAEKSSDDYDVVVAVGQDRRKQPLCAIYDKSSLPVLERQLIHGNGRLTDALDLLRTKYVRLAKYGYTDAALFNVNSVDEYSMLADYE